MMGNPWSYRGHNLEWSRIRLLTKWDDIEMEYNASGMRTRKGDTYYELDGNNIISETTNGNTIRYYYGNGGIVGFRYNGNRYYYEKNLQGDIIAIYDEDGSKLCEYIYDAWGNCTIKNDVSDARIGEVNSFRYRGYYYDSDIGLYYLKSRYYDPQIARFINADEISYLGANGDLSSYDLFAYCSDSPVKYKDPNGNLHPRECPGFAGGGGSYGGGGAGSGVIVEVVVVTATVVTIAYSHTIDDLRSEKFEIKKREYRHTEKDTYSVYFLKDDNGVIQYVGRVTDRGYKARLNYHKNTRGLKEGYRIAGLNKIQARGLEEIGMILCHTLKPGKDVNNQIHGISARNPNGKTYLNAGWGYLSNHIENWMLNYFN